jgi:ApbE superfamily uncharacterized protein (UPF0280 family)
VGRRRGLRNHQHDFRGFRDGASDVLSDGDHSGVCCLHSGRPGTGAGVGTANAVTVFGQLPDSAANQAAVPGSYTDTITVTITY